MENQFSNKNIIIFLIIVLVIVVLLWLILPKFMNNSNTGQEYFKQDLLSNDAEFNYQNDTDNTDKLDDNEDKNAQNIDHPFIDQRANVSSEGIGQVKGRIDGMFQHNLSTFPSNYYLLDDGAQGEMSLQNNLCSKSCCGPQWPVPFKQSKDPYVCANKQKFVGSNMFCNNNFQDSGCLCLEKDQALFLYNRGGNGRELF